MDDAPVRPLTAAANPSPLDAAVANAAAGLPAKRVTAIGYSSWKPTPPSRPNTSCSLTIWARIPTSSWSARSLFICGAYKALTAAGRSITMARSTSAPRSRPTSP